MKTHNITIVVCLIALCYIGISRVTGPQYVGYKIQPLYKETACSYMTRANSIIMNNLDLETEDKTILRERYEIVKKVKKLVGIYSPSNLGISQKLPIDEVTELHRKSILIKERIK